MTLLIREQIVEPSQQTGYARHQGEALFPQLWDGATYAIFPNMGPANRIYDYTGRHGVSLAEPNAMSARWDHVSGQWGYEHTGTGIRTWLRNIDDIVPLNNVSFVMGYEKADATIRAGGAFGNTNLTTAARCGCFVPFSDGAVYWDFGGNVSGTSRCDTTNDGAGNPTLGNDSWAFMSGSRGMSIWQNGNKIAGHTGSATRTTSPGKLSLGTHAGLGSDLAYYYYLVVYGRELSPEEIDLWHRYPKAMLMPSTRTSILTTGVPTDHTRSESHVLGITDAIVNTSDFPRSLSDTMSLSDQASFLSVIVQQDLSLVDGVLYFLAIDDFKPISHNLGLTDYVITSNTRTVDQDLGITDSVDWSGFANGDAYNYMGLQDNAVFCYGAPWAPIEVTDTLEFTQVVGFGIPVSVTNILSLTDEGARVLGGHSILNFIQTVIGGIGEPAQTDALNLVQTVTTENLFTRSLSHTTLVEDAMAYYIENPCTNKQYNRFEGAGSAAGIPDNALTFDANFVLETLVGTKDTLQLRNPETDDRHRIGYSRINRETQGGELNVFADPSWPQVETLLFTIVALSDGQNCPDKINSLMDFMQTNLGQEILLHDWEGISWRGVIITPNEVATEDREGWWTISFEFEGTALDGSQGDQAMAFVDAVGLNMDHGRSVTDDLGLVEVVTVAGILEESVTDTLALSDSVGAEVETVLLLDAFTGSGATDLHGQSPSGTGSSTWAAHTNYKADGTQTAIDSGAYYPISPANGHIYYIEWSPRALAESDGLETTLFLGEGFPADADYTGAPYFGRLDPTVLKAGFVLRKIGVTQLNACRLGDSNDGEVDTVDFTDGALKALSDNIDLRLVLDTTGGTNNWTATWYAKGILSSVWVEVRAEESLLAEDITMVGWANNNTTTTVDLDLITITKKVSV